MTESTGIPANHDTPDGPNGPDGPDATPIAAPGVLQKVAAEVIGTFVLVLFGCGAAVFSNGDYVGTALAFGLAVLVMAYAFGRVSGGHFNPAITVGAAIGGRIAWRETPIYIVSQLVGAILGALTLFVVAHGFPGFDATGNMGQNAFGDQANGYAWWAALILEMVLTAIFVMVVLAVTDARDEHPGLAPLAIGLALSVIHLVAISATGTSVNPARSIGPALFAGTDAIIQLWLFIVAPLLGALIAGLAYPALFGHGTDPVPGSGLALPVRTVAPGVPQDRYQQQWNQQSPQQSPQQSQQQSQQQWGGGQWGAQGGGAAQSQWGPEPIIQDGWQWDPHAQQWIPAQQQPPAAQGYPQTGQQQGYGQPGQHYGQPEPGDDEDGGEGRTQIRPGQ